MQTKGRVDNFIRDEESLMRAADKRISSGDYLGALRFLNSRNRSYSPDQDAYLMQADLFEYLESASQALKVWYAFLDVCDEESYADAYEGLAVNYMNLGKETQAAYYYNLLLQVDKEISEESKMEIVETFSKPPKSPLRIVYPPEKVDYAENCDKGLGLLRQGKFAEARSVFEEVAPCAKQYTAARNLTAVTYLLEEKNDEAEKICIELLQKDPENVQANTTYAAVLGQKGEREKATEIAKKLAKISTKETDELYKISTVCCENGLHSEAYQKFCVLQEEIGNDKTLLYLQAVSAYKSGLLDVSIGVFERLLTIYPDAAVADYYYHILRYYRDNRDKEDVPMPELTYFYTLPPMVKEKYCSVLCLLDKLKSAEAQSVGDDVEITGILNWCFDESDGMELDLQHLAISVAVHIGAEKFLRRILLQPDVNDPIKLFIIEQLIERNKGGEYGVVVCHFYRRLPIYRVHLGVHKRKRFLHAYSSVYSKFAVVSERYGKRICATTELIYRCLGAEDKFYLAESVEDLSAAIYVLSGIKEGGGTVKAASELFSANEERVENLVRLVKEITKKVLQEKENRNSAGKEDVQDDGTERKDI